MFYAHDNRDKVPYADIWPRNTNAPVWVQGELNFNPANTSNWSIAQDIQISPLWNYCLSAEIWRCPADRSVVNVSGQLVPRVRTMAMNGYVGGSGGGRRTDVTVGGRIFLRLSDMTDPGPSRTFLLIDQREDAINYTAGFTIDMNGYRNNPALRQ